MYFFAFNLSIQVLTLFSANMSNVLLAALAKLKDERERQVAAFLRACRVFACFAVPACIVQIVLGRPGILLLFGRKWEDSILMFQILAAGMTVPLVTGFAWPMLQAQGRFRFVAAWTTTMAVIFLLMVQIGTRWHGAVGTAYAIAISHVVLGLIGMRLALSRDGSWKDVASVFVPSTIASIVAGFAGFGVLMIVPRVMDLKTPIWLTLLLMAASSGVFALVYALIMRTLWRSHYLEMRDWTMAAVQRAGRSVFRQT
jgi:O-antigen/teichoic acid export membrane protein